MAEQDDLDEEQRLLLAAHTARRIVSQCRAHADAVLPKLTARIRNAAPGTPCGLDVAAARAGHHMVAFQQRIDVLESMSNALISHLHGLEVLLNHETLYTLPTVPIIRSLAEVAATSSWMLQPGISTDDRTARGYASLFQTVEQNKSRMPNASEIRERLVTIVIDGGGRIQRRVSNGVTSVEVGTVRVGRAHAKTAFKYQTRLQQQIPSISKMYSGMSAMIHGEDSAMGLAWDGPDVMMRMVAKVTLESTRAWSTAVHTWTGVELQLSFVNAEDERNIIRSMPAEQLALFEAERQHRWLDASTRSDS